MSSASPATMRHPAPGSARAWVLAARPATLPVSVAPVLVGAAATMSTRSPVAAGPVLAALLGALLIQIGTNFANDVFDFEKGADTSARLGPVRATQAGLLSPSAVRAGMVASFALAALVGVYLALVGGFPIVAIGIASIVSGVAYTGGPFPLGYNGLGDVFVFVFFGPVAVCATSYLAGGAVPLASAGASVAVGALSTAVLVVNNVRDEPTDRAARKRTLVVRFGRAFGIFEYHALTLIAYAAIAFVAYEVRSSWPLLALGTAPLAVRLARGLRARRGAALNPLLGGTARLLLFASALLAVGLVLVGRSG